MESGRLASVVLSGTSRMRALLTMVREENGMMACKVSARLMLRGLTWGLRWSLDYTDSAAAAVALPAITIDVGPARQYTAESVFLLGSIITTYARGEGCKFPSV